MTAFRRFDAHAALAELAPQNFRNLRSNEVDISASQPDQGTAAAAGSIDIDECASIIERSPGVPRAWTDGLTRLCAMQCPTSVPERRWQQVIDNARTFNERWATQAAALGWDTGSVFGCHRTHPDVRLDLKGLVWLIGEHEVVALCEQTATIRTKTGAAQTYRRVTPRPSDPVVAAWELEQ